MLDHPVFLILILVFSLVMISCRKETRVEFSDNDIVGDLALYKPIEEYPISIRDEVRRCYLVKGLYQLYGHEFPLKKLVK